MDTKLLHDFIALSETKQFTLAAEKRFITQSAFSRRIQHLENWAGLELVIRHKNTISFTPAGQKLLDNAQDIINKITHTKRLMTEKKNNTEKKISISSQNTIMRTFLPKWIGKIEQKIGEVYWSLQSEKMSLSIESFLSKKVDLLFCYKSEEAMRQINQDKHDYITVSTDTLIPVVKADGKHATTTLNGNNKISIPFLAYSPNSFFAVNLESLINSLEKNCAFETKFDHHYSNALHQAVLQDRGMAWLPASSIQGDLENGTLKIVGDTSHYLDLEIILCSYKEHNHALHKEVVSLSRNI